MFGSVVQGITICSPMLLGLGGLLINGWVISYRDDKHFYETRFLDQDGDPNSDDPGYIKDASGKLCPVIVKKYSFGCCKKERFVEGVEITEDGKNGLPFKMSLKDFRSQVIRGPEQPLSDDDIYLLRRYNISVGNLNTDQIDLKGIFDKQTDLLALGQRLAKWEKDRPVALAKVRTRLEKLEKAVAKKVKPPEKK